MAENESILQKLGAIFTDVLGKLGKKGEKRSIIGIDIGSSFIKIVQIGNKGGKAILETYGEIALGPYGEKEFGQATQLPPEKLSQALSDLFKEAQVTTKDAAIAIPLRASLLSLMEVPLLKSKKDFEAMIPIEARKYIPVSISEVTVDWWVVPRIEKDDIPEGARGLSAESDGAHKTKKTEMAEVMVVAIRNDVISQYQNIVSLLGLQSVFFELEIFSVVRSTFGKGMAPILFIDIGAGATKIAIIEYGVVKFSHTINRGSQDISISVSASLSQSFGKAEELKRTYGLLGAGNVDENNKYADIISEVSRVTLESIFSEINESLLSYQAKHAVSVEQAMITGGGALLKGLLPFAKERLGIEVSLGNAFGRMQTPAFLESALAETGPEFAVAAGLALRKLQGE